MRSLSTRNDEPNKASRPFDDQRDGFIISEGGGIIILEELTHALERGAKIYAEIIGHGMSSDAYHFTLPNRETIIRAIRGAIDDADLQPEDVQYVNAHGTSTPKGDKIEIECLREIFDKRLENIPVSSNKSQIGHTLGASAAIEAALGIEAMHRGVILPTVNHIPDPELSDIDVVPNETRSHTYEFFLSNAFGFGGTNCCVVFRGV